MPTGTVIMEQVTDPTIIETMKPILVDFDEAEIFDAYKQIYRNDKEQNAELVIKYNDTRTSLELYLRSKSEEIEIEKCKIKIYKRTKWG